VPTTVERVEIETARVREIDAYYPCVLGEKHASLSLPSVFMAQNIHGGEEACF
jgi:hypothetical protein